MSYYLTDRQFDVVMKKLFRAVGCWYESIEKSCGKDWYMKHTWTEKQEAEFRKWFTSYIVKKLDIPVRSADKRARMFLFECGWKHVEGGDVG